MRPPKSAYLLGFDKANELAIDAVSIQKLYDSARNYAPDWRGPIQEAWLDGWYSACVMNGAEDTLKRVTS